MQIVVFTVASAASLLVLRPVARRHLRTPAPLRTGTAALVGEPALVLERVDGDGGQVKLRGEVWTARAYDDDEVIEPGTRVHVMQIGGATALVSEASRRRTQWPPSSSWQSSPSSCWSRSRRACASSRRRAPASWSAWAATTARSTPAWRWWSPTWTASSRCSTCARQVVSFPPQPVITEDNLTIQIDTVIYFQVTDPKAATYEIADYIAAIEQLTVTTLRNVCGGMTLEDTLTSRDKVSAALRVVLDEATGNWGIRVNRVELKAVDPPPSIQEAMEKQMRAERDRRAAILTAEGVKQSQILTAEGEKQSSILRAEGQRESQILRPRASPRRSRPCSTPSTGATPTPSCWPTSTCRCCPRSPRATPTRSGSSRRSSPRRSGNLGSVIGAAGEQGSAERDRAASGRSPRPTRPAPAAGATR